MALEHGVNVKECYIDTVGDPKRYQEFFEARFPGSIKFTVESKADANYSVTSAASIVAKFERDEALKNWEFREEEPEVV